MSTRRLLLALLLAATVLAARPFSAQSPDSEVVLDKAARLRRRLYARLRRHRGGGELPAGGPRRARPDLRGYAVDGPRQKRDLKSDVLIVRGPAGERWMQFRDVFEVDGKPIRDRAERLAKLFLEPVGVGAAAGGGHRRRERPLQHRRDIRERQPAGAGPERARSREPALVFVHGHRKNESVAGGLRELEYREEREPHDDPHHRRPADAGAWKASWSRAPAAAFSRPSSKPTTIRACAHRRDLRARNRRSALFVPREMREKYVTNGGTDD